MNLVGGYDSSDDDDEQRPPQPQQHKSVSSPITAGATAAAATAAGDQQRAGAHNKAKGKGKAPPDVSPTPAASKHRHDRKKRKGEPGATNAKEKKKKKKTKKFKVVNALVLSPEIQAALARGDALGDSDSDEAPERKPPKVSRPAGSNPNDLLSLLPKPSTVASADDILLKSRQKRRDAAAAKKTAKSGAGSKEKEAKTTSGATMVAHASTLTSDAADCAAAAEEEEEGEEQEQESESDEGGDDLLASIRAKSATSGAGSSSSTPLFTLPSRAKPPPAAGAVGAVGAVFLTDSGGVLDEDGAGVGAIPGMEHSGMPPQIESGMRGQGVGQQWDGLMPKEGGTGGESAYTWRAGAASQAPLACNDAAATSGRGSGAYQMAYGASSVEVRSDTDSLRAAPNVWRGLRFSDTSALMFL